MGRALCVRAIVGGWVRYAPTCRTCLFVRPSPDAFLREHGLAAP